MDYEECVGEGKIRKRPDAERWAGKELETAEKFLLQAEKVNAIAVFETAEVAAYASAFHSARALLFAKGYSEKGHHCLFVALRHLYQQDAEAAALASEAARLSESRNETVYGGKTVSKEEAAYSLGLARRMLDAAKKRLA